MSVQGTTQVPSYNLEKIQHYTQPKKPSGFRRFLGAVAGGITNLVAPGAGVLVDRLISRGSGLSGGALGNVESYVQKQQQVINEQLRYQMAITILQIKSQTAMAAIRGMKTS